jgi:hypothetical protein
MTRISIGRIGILLALILNLFTMMLPGVSRAESSVDAIARIRAGRHHNMPPPQTVLADGPAGKGMTIENKSRFLLRVHFAGPKNITVEVPGGRLVDVALFTGTYEVAGEMLGAEVIPFYGKQTYQPNAHYWLKFFVERR